MSQLESASQPQSADHAPIGRVVLVAVVLIAAAVVVHLTPMRSYISQANELSDEAAAAGVWVYPLAIAATALLLACGVPRLALHAAGGALFGFAVGLLLTMIGAVLGHYAVFVFIRWGGKDWALARWPALERWANLVQEHGIVGVLLARQLPAHSMIINAALAISHVRTRHFLIGTSAGLLPEAIPATLIGAGLMHGSLKASAGYFAVAVAAFALVWIAGVYVFRALRKHQQKEIVRT